MEWHATDAQSLIFVDQELDEPSLAPAELEIVRQVIYATGDFGYQSLIGFSDQVLSAGAAALAARTPILVDVPMVQAGITAEVQSSFANPIYCGRGSITRPQKLKTQATWGLESLVRRYPEAIVIVGEAHTALTVLADLIEAEEIKPALIIATPPGFLDAEAAKLRLRRTWIPLIDIRDRRGGSTVAVAIANSLIDLAWQAYGQDDWLGE